MGIAKFNENGVLVDSETGMPVGTKHGNTTTIDSSQAEPKTLEDYGVMLPDFPDEDENADNEDEDEDFKMVGGGNRIPLNKSKPVNSDLVSSSHIDHGETSYKVKRSKYEITKDSYFMIRFGLIQKEDGRFVPIRHDAVDEMPNAESHWVKFRMWNYDEELTWKSNFLEYNNASKMQMINQDKLNECKLKHLMLDWSFGEYDDRLKLLHCDGVLSDESYGIIKGMYPSIVVTIIELMNLVLESNQ